MIRALIFGIDPPDLAPYISRDLDDPTGFPPGGFPYHLDDNVAEVPGEYGLSLNPDGAGATETLTVTPGADDLGTFYLKVPPNVSGNNYQVKVSKTKQGPEAPIADRVVGLSPFYTTWKRIYVERDKMFREGGLLARDYDPATAPVANRIRAWNWTNVQVGDEIVLFQSDRPASSGSAEYGVVKDPIVDTGDGETVFLDIDLGVDDQNQPLLLERIYEASVHPVSQEMDFSQGKSAGFGVVSGCDSASNQINDPGSCFFDADMRGIEQPFADGSVQFFGRTRGSGAIPYAYGGLVDLSFKPVARAFSQQWFENKSPNAGDPLLNVPQDYFHLVGAAIDPYQSFGFSDAESDYSFIMIAWIEGTYDPLDFERICQHATVHEFGHQFRINPCDFLEHDENYAWCGDLGGACPDPYIGYEICAMYVAEDYMDGNYMMMIGNDILRFCCSNLNGTIDPPEQPPCGNEYCLGEVGIRGNADPE